MVGVAALLRQDLLGPAGGEGEEAAAEDILELHADLHEGRDAIEPDAHALGLGERLVPGGAARAGPRGAAPSGVVGRDSTGARPQSMSRKHAERRAPTGGRGEPAAPRSPRARSACSSSGMFMAASGKGKRGQAASSPCSMASARARGLPDQHAGRAPSRGARRRTWARCRRTDWASDRRRKQLTKACARPRPRSTDPSARTRRPSVASGAPRHRQLEPRVETRRCRQISSTRDRDRRRGVVHLLRQPRERLAKPGQPPRANRCSSGRAPAPPWSGSGAAAPAQDPGAIGHGGGGGARVASSSTRQSMVASSSWPAFLGAALLVGPSHPHRCWGSSARQQTVKPGLFANRRSRRRAGSASADLAIAGRRACWRRNESPTLQPVWSSR